MATRPPRDVSVPEVVTAAAAGWLSRQMTAELHADPLAERHQILDSVRPRLTDLSSGADVEALLNTALDELTPATVTTYLPILVERRVRERLGTAGPDTSRAS